MRLANIPYKLRANGCVVNETTNDKGTVGNEILFRLVYSDNMVEHALSLAMFEWLSQELNIVVCDRGPETVHFDTLYLWNGWGRGGSGVVGGVSGEDARKNAIATLADAGKFYGRWRGKSAVGNTLVELLQHLDLRPSFRPWSPEEEKYQKRPY